MITVQLDYLELRSHSRRVVQVQFRGFARPLTIWEGDGYDAAGNYTQSDLQEAVLAKLGSDPTASLALLARPFPPPPPKIPPKLPPKTPPATPLQPPIQPPAQPPA